MRDFPYLCITHSYAYFPPPPSTHTHTHTPPLHTHTHTLTHTQWYYFFCSRNTNPSKFATALKWTVTPRGKRFLLSAQWASEVKLGSRLYQGHAGTLPRLLWLSLMILL